MFSDLTGVDFCFLDEEGAQRVTTKGKGWSHTFCDSNTLVLKVSLNPGRHLNNNNKIIIIKQIVSRCDRYLLFHTNCNSSGNSD